MSYLFLCPECSNKFDDTHKPCLGLCDDTICLPCIEHHVNCPICKRKGAFSQPEINYVQMQTMEGLCIEQFTYEIFTQWRKESTWSTEEEQCSKCGSSASRLRICLKCAAEAGLVIELGTDFNNANDTLEDLYTSAKQLAMCVDCIIDEHDDYQFNSWGAEKEHRYMRLAQLFAGKEFHSSKVPEVYRRLLMAGLWESPARVSYFHSFLAAFFLFTLQDLCEFLVNVEAIGISSYFLRHIAGLMCRRMINVQRSLMNLHKDFPNLFDSTELFDNLRNILNVTKVTTYEVVDDRIKEELFKYCDDLNQNLLLDTLKALEKVKKVQNARKKIMEKWKTNREEMSFMTVSAMHVNYYNALKDLILCYAAFIEFFAASEELGMDFEHENFKNYFAKFENHRVQNSEGRDKSKILFWLSD